MTPKEFRKSIERSFDLAEALGLSPIPSNLYSLEVDDTARDLAIGGSSFPEYYTYCVENRIYNFILRDGAYLQFEATITRRSADLRFCYVPSPFEPLADDQLDLSEMGPIDRVVRNNALPILRYEYAEKEYRPFAHPTSHLHLGFGRSGRLLVDRILAPHSFFSVVARWLYPRDWYNTKDDDESYEYYVLERELAQALGDCPIVPANYIDDAERTLLHLGALRKTKA